MSVRVQDTRIVISEADGNVGGTWTGAGGAFVSTPSVESTAAWVGTENIGTASLYIGLTTPVSAVGQMTYVWSNNFALQLGWLDASPPNAMYLSDGTNHAAFRLAGSNKKEFSHLSDQDWNWDCLLIDMDMAATWNSLGYVQMQGGSFVNFNSASVNRFGAHMTTKSKGLGGGTNVAVDIIRMGNNGLIVTSGSLADPGKFTQIVVEDRSTANLKAHGIIREYTTGVYGIQGPLTFGTQSALTTYFSDENVVLNFEDRVVANNKYYLKVSGSATATTQVFWNGISINTAGPHVMCDFSASGNIRTLEIQGCSFNNLVNPIYFGNDTSASFHDIGSNIFTGCGIIDIGRVYFHDNSIRNSSNMSGSILLDWDSTGSSPNYQDLTFVGNNTRHAIYITHPGTYNFTNFNYSGFAATNEATASVIYNNSGGAVTINVLGGDNPSYRNGAGATTTVNNQVTLTLTGLKENTEATVVSASVVLYHVENVDITGIVEYSYNYTPGQIVDILIFHVDYNPNLSSIYDYTLPDSNATIPIQQITDLVYNNP